jgi:hypothetical protein
MSGRCLLVVPCLGRRPLLLLGVCATPTVRSASELCVCGDACPMLLLLGDGYLPRSSGGLVRQEEVAVETEEVVGAEFG